MENNVKLIASISENLFDNSIKKEYYIYCNGNFFITKLFSNKDSASALNIIPIYHDYDLQLVLKGICGLNQIKPINYTI